MSTIWMNSWETYRLVKQTFDGNGVASEATELIDARGYRMAVIYVPANWTSAKIVVKDCAEEDGTPVSRKDDILGANIAITAVAGAPVALKEYATPLSGLSFFRLGSVSTSDGSTPVGQAGTKASRTIAVSGAKTLTFTSGVGGTASNAITIAITTAEDDTLAITNSGTAITIALANTTASKNSASNIQTAIRALTVPGINMTGFTVTGSSEYNAAPPVSASVAATALAGGADAIVKVVLVA